MANGTLSWRARVWAKSVFPHPVRTISSVVANSSSMISLQRSMHSSQMYTPGPAMSFLTCFCDLPQKLHLRSSPPSPNLAICLPSATCNSRRWLHLRGYRSQLPACQHSIDHTVIPCFLGQHPIIPLGVKRNFFVALAGVIGQDPVELVAHLDDQPSLYLDVARLA